MIDLEINPCPKTDPKLAYIKPEARLLSILTQTNAGKLKAGIENNVGQDMKGAS